MELEGDGNTRKDKGRYKKGCREDKYVGRKQQNVKAGDNADKHILGKITKITVIEKKGETRETVILK